VLPIHPHCRIARRDECVWLAGIAGHAPSDRPGEIRISLSGRRLASIVLATISLCGIVAGTIGSVRVSGAATAPLGNSSELANAAPVTSFTLSAPFAPGLRAIPRDSSRVLTTASMPRPGYLAPVVDPITGVTLTRVTGNTGALTGTSRSSTGTWSADARHHYSKTAPWNADGSLIAIDNDDPGLPTRVYLDGETYQVRYETCRDHRIGDDRWHPSVAHRNERISCSGEELTWFDVTTCTYTRRWDLPFWVKGLGMSEGNPSNDGRFIALTDGYKVFVVDMDPQAPLAPYPAKRIGPAFDVAGCGLATGCSVDWVSISPSGKYVVVKYDGDHEQVLDVNPTTLALTIRVMPSSSPRCAGSASKGFIYDLAHADLAIDPFDHDEDVIIGQEHCQDDDYGGVVKVRLRDGKTTSLTRPGKGDAYPHHVATRNLQRPGWAYVTYMSEPGKRYSNEVIALSLDGNEHVERFIQNHTNRTGCYRCEAHGTPSPDGRKVMFASNWMLDCTTCGPATDIKSYVADARALALPGATPLSPHVVNVDASASRDADGQVVSYKFDFGDGIVTGPQKSPRASHTYGTGRWNLRVTTTDDDGAIHYVTREIVVGDGAIPNRPPVARISLSHLQGLAPLVVLADASTSTDPDGDALTYTFDFGDGVVSPASLSPALAHTFGIGIWNLSVIVTDSRGARDTATATVSANASPPVDSLGPNLVANSSFEASTSGWSAYGSASVTRVPGGHDGLWSLQVRGPLSVGTFGLNDSPNWVGAVPAAGTRFRVSVWMRSMATLGRCRLRVREYRDGVTIGAAYTNYTYLGIAWQQFTLDYEAAGGGTTIDLQVLEDPVAGAESFLIDDISVRMIGGPTTGVEDEPLDKVALVSLAPRITPQPMRARGLLSLTTSQPGPLEVSLFDASGRRLRVLRDDAWIEAGKQDIAIDGRDDQGRSLPAGVYFCVVQSARGRETRRFALLR